MQQVIENNLNQKRVSIFITALQSGVAPAEWVSEYRESDTSESIAMSLQDACQAAATCQQDNAFLAVDLILPAEMATLHAVNLPSKHSRQAMQALPFVVEEQLAVDIEKVHLAVGARQSNGAWPVVVLDAALMSAVMACCERVGLRLRAVYMDAQLLPVVSDGLSIAMQGSRVLLRTATEMAVFDQGIASEMIHFFVKDFSPNTINVFFSETIEWQNLLAQQLATEFSALGDAKVEMVSDVKSLGVLLLSQLSSSAINLLQGRYFVRQPTGKRPIWVLLVAVAAVFWFGQFFIQVASALYFNHSADAMEMRMDAQFRKLFPSMRRVGGVKKQIETQLLVGASNGEGNSFANLFSQSIQVLNAMPDHQGFEITELRYDDQQGQVELEVKVKSIDQLDKYKQALGKAGLSAKISSANDGGNGVEGRMQINKMSQGE